MLENVINNGYIPFNNIYGSGTSDVTYGPGGGGFWLTEDTALGSSSLVDYVYSIDRYYKITNYTSGATDPSAYLKGLFVNVAESFTE